MNHIVDTGVVFFANFFNLLIAVLMLSRVWRMKRTVCMGSSLKVRASLAGLEFDSSSPAATRKLGPQLTVRGALGKALAAPGTSYFP